MQSMKSVRFRRWTSMPALLLTAALASGQEVDKALKSLKAGDWKGAIDTAGAVQATSAEFPRAQYVCGEAYLVIGDAPAAEASFRRVLEKNANATPAMIGLGRALTAVEKYSEAEEILVKAVKLDAQNPLALLALGQAHLALKKTKEAKAELAGAYELDPKDPHVVRGFCDWLFAENDNVRALKVAADLSKSQPKHPMGPFLEGLALERAGKDAKAIEAYEEAVKRDDTFLDAHKNLAIVCHTQNPIYQDTVRTEKCLEHYERYFALGGKDPELESAYRQFKAVYDEYLAPPEKKKKK